MSVLVGIPTHKRPDLLRECLASVERQVGALPEVSVFVADNDANGRAGAELATELATKFRFPLASTVVDEPGISAVRNAILDEARRRKVAFVAMIDDDETASPEWLDRLLAMQRSTSADVVGGPVKYSFATPPKPSVAEARMFNKKPRPAGKSPPLRSTANFMVSARALAAADWPTFDLDFGLTGGGDTEWFMRLGRLGLRFAWAPEAVTNEGVPPERATEEWVLKRAYRAGNSNMRAALKHWPSKPLIYNLGYVALAIGSAPLLAALLLAPKRRLWVRGVWRAAAGRTAALLGRDVFEYAVRHEAKE
jgi:succinoglycan biosynthesis protein ExoM